LLKSLDRHAAPGEGPKPLAMAIWMIPCVKAHKGQGEQHGSPTSARMLPRRMPVSMACTNGAET